MKGYKSLLRPSAAFITGLFLSACGNDITEPAEDGNPDSNNSSSGALSCEAPALPETPLRRLTRFEYGNAVKDLLGVDTSVVRDLPADVSDGFDNNAALQVAPELLVEKYVLVSENLASQAVENVTSLTNCNAVSRGNEYCANTFAHSFGRKAFRRALNDEDLSMFMAAYQVGADGGSHADGIEVMIRMALQSPNFLYRLELSSPLGSNQDIIPLNDFEIATRLSFFLWGTGPDDALLDSAAAGQLSSKEQVAVKARQMLESPKARHSLHNFLAQWSDVHKLETLTRNTNLFPSYSADVKAAMKRELPAFVNYMFDNKTVTLKTLLTSDQAFVSGPLASVYGVSPPSNSDTIAKRVTPAQEQGRSGLLTQAGFLAVQAHPDQTSPVLRGKFVRTNLLCDPPPPPPDNIDISVPEISSGPTARDRADIHLSAGGGCAGCHQLMDPIGLSFEHFDAMGQFRTQEAGHSIDVSGEVMFTNDPTLEGTFTGVRALGEKLASSELVQSCVSTQMFRFASGRYEDESRDACSLSTMEESFISEGGSLTELMVSVTQTDAFLYRNRETR